MKTKFIFLFLLVVSLANAAPNVAVGTRTNARSVGTTKAVTKTVSRNAVIKFNDVTLREVSGRFYKEVNSQLVFLMPPVGLRLSYLPDNYTTFVFRNKLYYYCRGVVYIALSNGEYEVVKAQVGMIVPDLPDEDVDKIKIEGKIYYKCGDVFYKQISTKSAAQFEVVGTIVD